MTQKLNSYDIFGACYVQDIVDLDFVEFGIQAFGIMSCKIMLHSVSSLITH